MEVVRVTLADTAGEDKLCGHCRNPIGDDFVTCPFCQHELKTSCGRCGTLQQEGWTSCPKCGLTKDQANQESKCGGCEAEVHGDWGHCPYCMTPRVFISHDISHTTTQDTTVNTQGQASEHHSNHARPINSGHSESSRRKLRFDENGVFGMSIEMQELLLQMVADRAASDLHLKADQPPILRVAGRLIRTSLPELSAQDVLQLIASMLTPEQMETLQQSYELDCSYGIEGIGRFRVNLYKDKGNFAAALRAVAPRIPSLQELGLPDICKEIAQSPRGLVLITGPTGHGKSTTLASMIDWINDNRADHILTIEDPIEYIQPQQEIYCLATRAWQ